MKTKNKSLISLMLAATMVAGVATMASGCSSNNIENGIQDDLSTRLTAKNLVVALYEKNVTIHKGDLYTQYYYGGSGRYSTTSKLVFNCGKEVMTEQFILYPHGIPEESEYDKICDYCFIKEA